MKLILTACCLLVACFCYSQKHDYIFIEASSNSSFVQRMIISYNDLTQDISIDTFTWSGKAAFAPTLSDKGGKFLCYTNNLAIWDSLGRKSINGDSIAAGFYLNYLASFLPEERGYGIGQNSAFIPISDSLFYLFHCSQEEWLGAPNWALGHIEENGVPMNAYSEGLWLTKLRLREDGRIYIRDNEKKIQLVDDILGSNQMTLIKQESDHDWWIILPRVEGDSAHFISLTVENETLEYKGKKYFSPDNGRVCNHSTIMVSPQGDRIARLYSQYLNGLTHKLEIFNFDRCTGATERIHFDSLEVAELASFAGDIEFSDNGRFLYVALSQYILQLDMKEEFPFDHIDTIAELDGFLDFNIPPLLDQMWKLPNGKILICGLSSTSYLNYIHEPNEKGGASNFEIRAIKTPPFILLPGRHIPFTTLPSYPQYRMPPLGHTCVVSTNEPIKNSVFVSLYPNPSVDQVWVQVQGARIKNATLYDFLGHTLANSETGYFDLRALISGVYFVEVETDRGVFARELVVR